ncbi:MAG: DNA internalization-related competence protein ComEC/Rec2 [Lachnospiraceae bacterium]|nr:DNA internalization-related competence protein ComEC/Rec2 [Lachnospiraceae bacterium]
MLYVTGGLVLGESIALWMTVKQGIFWLALGWLAVFWIGKRYRPAFLACVLLLIGACAGLIRMDCEQRRFAGEETGLEAFAGEEILVWGRVASIKRSQNGWRVELSGAVAGKEGRFARVRRMYGYFEKIEDLGIGTAVCVRGEALAAGSARNPGEFDYRLYCRSQGVGGIVYVKSYDLHEPSRVRPLAEGLRLLGERLGDTLSRVAEPADAGILKAVLLGDKTELSDSVYALYQRNGISHLLAISGLHVSLIGMSVWRALRKCGAGYGLAGLLAAGLLLGYGQMVGFGPSVTRAVCMLFLSFLAGFCGRSYDLLSSLCVPAAFLLLTRPYLLTQAGFQLSFLAVLGVLCPGGFLIKLGRGRPNAALLEAFSVSLSVQLMTAPAILYHSFEIPLYAVFLNLPIVALMPLAAASGFLGLSAALLWEPVGKTLLGGAHYILKLYELLCEGVERLPFAVLSPGRPKAWQIVSYYIFLAAGAFVLWRFLTCQKDEADRSPKTVTRPSARLHVLQKSICFWLLAALCLAKTPSPGLSVTFLDVGQGDGIFLSAGRHAILVDCGSSQEKKLGEERLLPFLKSRGVRKLDAVFITHGDADHISGIRYLLEEEPETKCQIGYLVMPKAGEGEEIYTELEALAARQGIPAVYAEKGDSFDGSLGKRVSIRCLYPAGDTVCKNRNDESLVLFVEAGNFRMLLTGDLEAEGESILLTESVLKTVTLLKAGHHGSASSSKEAFIQALQPKNAVLSYGRGNRYGHPAPEVTRRLYDTGAILWETARIGAVQVWTDGKRVRIKGFLQGRN